MRLLGSIGSLVLWAVLVPSTAANAEDKPSGLRIHWEKNLLSISGEKVPGGPLKIWYLEAYCRPGSTDRVWNKTTIGHTTKLLSASPDGKRIELECTLTDGVKVHHEIQAREDSVEFRLRATNPTDKPSLAHWAQPCMRVDTVTGRNQKTYLEKSFVFYDDKLTRMPTPHWARKARYVPGQVWCPKNVNRNDVNPRPLSDVVPSNGLIGCFSADEKMIVANAWEPYQELFQGVIVCLHSDFRIGGLKPGETKNIRGKVYIVDADVPALLKQYRKDFPEHVAQ